jgi:uncharacterized protein YbjT (DUF2867 family)
MILVTTPNGNVGSEVAKRLIAADLPVRLASNNPERTRAAFPSADVKAFDFFDPASVSAALEGVETVYLASPGVLVVNGSALETARQFLQQAVEMGVRRVVRLSAAGVEYGNGSLRQVEQFLEASELEWTLLRPNWYMQNYSIHSTSPMGIEAVRRAVLREPAAQGKTAYVDARDVAEVAVKALLENGHTGKAYTLTGTQALSRNEVAETFSRILGNPVIYTPVDEVEMRREMRENGAPNAYIDTMHELYGYVRDGATQEATTDVERVLSRDPITFSQFVEDYRTVWA